MKATIFAYTRHGVELSLKVNQVLTEKGYSSRTYTTNKFSQLYPEVLALPHPAASIYEQEFATGDALIFISATGIAVRSIAPYVRSKTTDPAVVVMDEQGTFVIPLLAGHIGGANALAKALATELKAVPVLTTATDVNELFSVDEWATQKGLHLASLPIAKDFAAYLVEGKTAGFTSDFPVQGKLPAGLKQAPSGELGVAITLNKDAHPFAKTLILEPKIVHLGIGCRRGIAMAAIEKLVLRELAKLHLSIAALAGVASIDVKKDEAGLQAFAAKYHLPLRFYTAQELADVPGKFTASAFVKKTVGVDNVCERAAVRNSKGGKLLLQKTDLEGVTLAIAEADFTVSFTK
jgi:cobalt-precorrin 5A hydrolase